MATLNAEEDETIQRRIPSFYIVWLDENVDRHDHDCRKVITQLQQDINEVNTFVDIDECMDFVTNQAEENIFMIVSEKFGQQVVSVANDVVQIKAIYIFCPMIAPQTAWTNKYSKFIGTFTNVITLCKTIDQATKDYEYNAISITFTKSSGETSTDHRDTLHCSFMYTQILKDILLSIDFNDDHFKEFLTYCQSEFAGNTRQLRNIERIEKEYHNHQPIWWYTLETFLYSMVNTALRTMDVDIIIKMGFFVRDLHQNIATLHSEQFSGPTCSKSFTVYRGQCLSSTDFNQLKCNQNGLLAFNNFLSTSTNRNVSLKFIQRNSHQNDVVFVLFVMHVDPSITNTPFANVSTISAMKKEEEILFSMHSVFRVGQIQEVVRTHHFWEVQLTLTSDNDPELRELTETIQEKNKGLTGWSRLGLLLYELNKFNQAEHLFKGLLKRANNQSDKASFFHQLGLLNSEQGKYDTAIEYYKKSFEIFEKILPLNHPNFAGFYNNIGLVYDNMGEYSRALEYYKKSLEILEKNSLTNHSNLATTYNNIGLFYSNIGDHSRALKYYEKLLETDEKNLLPNDPHLATSYNNIGFIHQLMGDYSKALKYHQKSFEIQKKTRPSNHPDLAMSYHNIGSVYGNMDNYDEALECYEKSLEILKLTLPSNHPDLATSYNNMGSIYYKMSDYSKALEYYKKSLEIFKKTLSPHHSHLANLYNNIGMVYNSLNDYSQALEYSKKSVEIYEKNLPPNHPSLSTSYNNIGLIYICINDYSKAREYYKKSLEIDEKNLPPNDPTLASSYNNIGLVYYYIGSYKEALKYFQCALHIYQRLLPSSHPDIIITGQYIEDLKKICN